MRTPIHAARAEAQERKGSSAHAAPRTPAVVRTLAPVLGPAAAGLFASSDETLAAIGTALAGALTALYVDWVDGRLAIERDRLVDTAVDIVVSLLSIVFEF